MLVSAHRFVVEIKNKPIGAFTECTLPTVKWEVEAIKEGGLNTYVHQLPKGLASSTITLKQGLGFNRALFTWYQATLQEKFQRKTVTIRILDSQLKKVYNIVAENTYPLEWTGPTLDSGGNTVAIESLVLACSRVTLEFP